MLLDSHLALWISLAAPCFLSSELRVVSKDLNGRESPPMARTCAHGEMCNLTCHAMSSLSQKKFCMEGTAGMAEE